MSKTETIQQKDRHNTYRRIRWYFSAPNKHIDSYFTLLTIVFFVAAIAWLLWGDYDFDSDLQYILPETDALIISHAEDAEKGIILAAISGGSSEQRAEASMWLTRTISDNPYVISVNNGYSNQWLHESANLFPFRYLLSPTLDESPFTENSLKEALNDRLREAKQSASNHIHQLIKKDPIGAWQDLLRSWQHYQQLPRPHGVWVSEDNEYAIVAIYTSLSEAGPELQDQWIYNLRQHFNQSEFYPSLDLDLTGTAVFTADSRKSVRSEITRLTIIASIFICVIFLWVFRSVTILFILGVPLVAGIAAGSALVSLFFGNIHGVALAFGIILLGISLDYPIHLAVHNRYNNNAWTTATNLWPTLRLSALSTIIGFGAMLLSDVILLSQIGVFAVGGILTSLFATRYIIPWALYQNTNVSHRSEVSTLLPSSIARICHSNVIPKLPLQRNTIGLLSLTLVATLCSGYLTWQGGDLLQTNIAELNPVPESTQKLDKKLRNELGMSDLRYFGAMHEDDYQDILEISHSLSSSLDDIAVQGIYGSFDHPSRWLPPAKIQAKRQQTIPKQSYLEKKLNKLAADVGFRTSTFSTFFESLEASREKDPLILSDLPDGILKLRMNNMLTKNADGSWSGLILFNDVIDPCKLEKRLSESEFESIDFVDSASQISEALDKVRTNALYHLGLGLVFISALLTLHLGSFLSSLRIVLVPVTAVLATTVCLSLIAHNISIFHLAALLLVAGLGIDYTLFLMRHSNHKNESQHTLRALLICLSSTIILFGALITSEIKVLSDIGATVAIGVSIAFLLAQLACPHESRSLNLHSSCK
ncbi:MMPL family transporter [Halorhodospira halochloris]|uniref:MMPL family transporter n=1 Tax=Halorhodospira halochloris TaxID=1052 RepID=UPI001EE91BE5|nr:MMPL family transporter [Halorhodospira halochloris]MCG5529928.1 MMPL family transporter [Halorhodospira halochloris]